MTLKLVPGKDYRTRNGTKVRLYPSSRQGEYPFYHDMGRNVFQHYLRPDGTSCIDESGYDIVAEWEEPEAVTITVDALELMRTAPTVAPTEAKPINLVGYERKALLAWAETREDWDIIGFAGIAAKGGIDLPRVRRAVRGLARKGLAKFHQTSFDDEGVPKGAGYGLTKEGRELLESMLVADAQKVAA